MKLQVLVRSPDWLQSAGTRIRYRRLQSEFSRFGCQLAIDSMSNIREGLKLNADAYLFSKCQDAGALMLAETLREAGAVVGFDLFDDYISGTSSLTFAQRHFQNALRERVDFFLCSTDRMSTVSKSIAPHIPTHVLNDPLEPVARQRLLQLLQEKAENVRRSGRINVLWFGNGNNPLFPVGISDLIAFSETLAPLRAAGLDVHLKVLTNAGALDPEGLGRLRAISFPLYVEEWSTEAEKASLEQAMLAFLPVNYQDFSIAKSLNRAITALTHGTQILTAGYPLYAALDDLIYRDAGDFISDLRANTLKLGPSSLERLDSCLNALADPSDEAARFIKFLTALPVGAVEKPVERRPIRAIVHGAASTAAVHNLGRSLAWLSLASPLTRTSLPFDAQIGFFDGAQQLQFRLMRDTLTRLAGTWRDEATALSNVDYGDYSHALPLPETEAGQYLGTLTPQMFETRARRMLHYEAVMTATGAVFKDVFGEMLLMRSEMEMPLPGMVELQAAGA